MPPGTTDSGGELVLRVLDASGPDVDVADGKAGAGLGSSSGNQWWLHLCTSLPLPCDGGIKGELGGNPLAGELLGVEGGVPLGAVGDGRLAVGRLSPPPSRLRLMPAGTLETASSSPGLSLVLLIVGEGSASETFSGALSLVSTSGSIAFISASLLLERWSLTEENGQFAC